MYTIYKCQLVIQPARLLAQNCTSQSENLPSKFGCLRHLLTCQDCLPIIIMPSAHCNVWLFVHGGPKKQKKRPIVNPQCLSWSSVASYYVELRTHKAYASQLQIPRPIIVCGTGCAKPADSTLMMIFTYVAWFIPSFCTSWTNYRASTLRLRQAYRRQIKAFLNFRYSLPLTWRANGNWKIPNAPARGAGSALALVMSSSSWPLMFDTICKQSEHECTTRWCPNLT